MGLSMGLGVIAPVRVWGVLPLLLGTWGIQAARATEVARPWSRSGGEVPRGLLCWVLVLFKIQDLKGNFVP